ncbi:MAG: hypothetical protein CO189_08045 [candidate division Zixibacteria bacterium CG_4_9_14_3_um_filter_46_8]|nr:MAG: hypothetical protein CO189_08045 [candidate division Zixibacteria bacterium CG_4_9_14_3_um_filter_46_8]
MQKTFEPKFNITSRITASLTLIERARGFLEAADLSEVWVREMGHRALILLLTGWHAKTRGDVRGGGGLGMFCRVSLCLNVNKT